MNSGSFSAPKITTFSIRSLKIDIEPTISNESSPSSYSIINQPLFSSGSSTAQAFFDESTPISSFHLIADLSSDDSFDALSLKESIRRNKSDGKMKINFGDNAQPYKNIMFEEDNEETSEDSHINDPKLLDVCRVQLKQPPIGKFKKRKERCVNNGHVIIKEKAKGIVQNYCLKKRFGFVKTDNSKIFVYEDDIALSGISLRQFKSLISKKVKITVEFDVAKVIESDKEKLKAINIKFIYDQA